MLIFEFMNWSITYYNERVRKEVPGDARGHLGRLRAAHRCHGGAWCRFANAPFQGHGSGLFELPPKGQEGIGRVFYCTQVGQSIVVLHSFVKKTQETPDAELRLARKRLKDVQHG